MGAAPRLAVQRCTSSNRCSSAIGHLAGSSTSYYWWLDLKREQGRRCEHVTLRSISYTRLKMESDSTKIFLAAHDFVAMEW
jgi:hypothetical protein